MEALVGGVPQEQLHQNILKHVHVNRERTTISMNKGSLPTFVVGDYVMAARVHERGELKLFVSNWMGPWRMVLAGGQHVYGMEDVVGGNGRMRMFRRIARRLADCWLPRRG